MSDWRKAGCTAVITGGASGLGLEAARRYASAGMNLVLIDHNADKLTAAAGDIAELAGSSNRVMTLECDVSDMDAMRDAARQISDRFGAVHCLMNNAGLGLAVGPAWENLDALQTTLSINLMGVVHGCHAFIPDMLAHGQPGVVINTGSKQGITRPPGNYAYNLSKAGVLAYTESVAAGFRGVQNCQLSAHLLVPGFVYTPMIEAFIPQKPPFAWTAQQTIDFMLPCLDRGDFYIICPDNESPREVDEKRVQWTAGDIIANRPALSRWHPDYAEAFEAFMKGD